MQTFEKTQKSVFATDDLDEGKDPNGPNLVSRKKRDKVRGPELSCLSLMESTMRRYDL